MESFKEDQAWMELVPTLARSKFGLLRHPRPSLFGASFVLTTSQDHAEIVNDRTHVVRDCANLEDGKTSEPSTDSDVYQMVYRDISSLARALRSNPSLLRDEGYIKAQLLALASDDASKALEMFLEQLERVHNTGEIESFVNAKNIVGETLLMISAVCGMSGVVGRILNLGAKVNAQTLSKITALDYATDAGHFTISQQLLEAGADISKASLFKKIFSNKSEYAGEITHVFEEQAASKSIRPEAISYPVRPADLSNTENAKRIADKYTLDYSDVAEPAQMALFLASMKNDAEMLEMLLRGGVDINTTSVRGWTALMRAVQRGSQECARLLLSRGADANHLSRDKWSALVECVNNGSLELIGILLDAGADIDMKTQFGWTPIMHVAYRGDLSVVELLLSKGASLAESSPRDETVILLASAAGSAEIVKLLLENGCPPDSRWSRKAQKEVEDREVVAAGAGQPLAQRRATRLLKLGWTPLMVACQVGNLEIVKLLVEAGANPEAKNPTFKTALGVAEENGRSDIIEYLVDKFGDESA